MSRRDDEKTFHKYCKKNNLKYLPVAGGSSADKPPHEKIPDAKTTHYFMNGGKLAVPDDKHNAFLEAYAQGIANDEEIYMIEVRTPWFRWHADLDFLGPHAVGRDKLLEIITCIQNCIKTFYPDTSACTERNCLFDLVALEREVVQKRARGSVAPEVSTGVHLVMPNLAVTQVQCQTMRLSIIAELQLTVAEMEEFNPWEAIVDATVYVGNGLRAPGSHKAVKCGHCKGDREAKAECLDCKSRGFKDVGRVYRPSIYLLQTGECDDAHLSKLQNSICRMVIFLTIRLPYVMQTPEWVRPEHAPHCPVLPPALPPRDMMFPSFLMPKASNIRLNRHVAPDVVYHEDVQSQQRKWPKAEVVTLAPNLVDALQTFLRTQINKGVYGKIQIRNILSSTSKKAYIVNVKGFGAQNCSNLRDSGTHNSNAIYFLVQQAGVRQLCHCTCTGDDKRARRRQGLCKDYKGPLYPLPPKLAAALFPLNNQVNPLVRRVESGSGARNKRELRHMLKLHLDRTRSRCFGEEEQ